MGSVECFVHALNSLSFSSSLQLMRWRLFGSSSLLSPNSSMLTDCFSCCAEHRELDSDPWEEVLAAAPPRWANCSTDGGLLPTVASKGPTLSWRWNPWKPGGGAWSQLPCCWTPWNMGADWPYGGWIPGGPKGLKFCRKLDVPKGNWDWGVGGENWPLPFDEYWDGESWFRRFQKNLGEGSIGRLCSRVDLRCWELSNKLQVWVRRGSKQASEDEANALQFCRGASRHVKRRSTASFLS